MTDSNIITHALANSLLLPEGVSIFAPAEHQRRWSQPQLTQNQISFPQRFNLQSTATELWNKPLLRIWDHNSGSQPDDANRMLARAHRQKLDTVISRQESLQHHHDNSNWSVKTPYISFTSSPNALRDLANYRLEKRNRYNQQLTVINPQKRLALGLPILHVADEMAYYGISNPYRSDYYTDHYLCLWEVTPAEVVGTWSWEELRRDPRWYERVIVPAYQAALARGQEADVRTQALRVSDVDGEAGLTHATDSVEKDGLAVSGSVGGFGSMCLRRETGTKLVSDTRDGLDDDVESGEPREDGNEKGVGESSERNVGDEVVKKNFNDESNEPVRKDEMNKQELAEETKDEDEDDELLKELREKLRLEDD